MSFKAELEALIANANSSLEDLEAILRRAQSRSVEGGDPQVSEAAVKEIQAQLDTVRQRILTSLLEIRESYNHDQERLSDLEGELKLGLENVRQCAIDYFIKGQYRECGGLLSFLSKVQPYDEELEKFLDLSRRKQLENETGRNSAAPDSQSHSKDGDHEQQLPHEQPVEGIPQRKAGGDDLEPSLRKAEEMTVSTLTAAAELNCPPSVFEAGRMPLAQSVNIKPLSETELRTAAHIDEPYRTLPNATKPHFLVWVAVAGLLLATTLFWLSRPRPESSIPESLSPSPSKVAEQVSPEGPLGSLRQEAQALFHAGKLQEAERVYDEILAKKPQDASAIALKDYIRATLAKRKLLKEEATPPQETAKLQQTSPGPPSSRLQPQNQPPPLGSSLQQAPASVRPTVKSKQADREPDKRGEPSPARDLPSAKQADKAPAPVAPTVSTATQVATAPQISPDALLELNNRIQARDFNQARLLLERLESSFPGNRELRGLGERLKTEVDKYEDLASSWIQKAEVAQSAGRYVTPPEDNAVVYCNQALKADPNNQRALSLKRVVVDKAVAQAKDWVQQGKFDAARLFFASMGYLALKDDSFPVSKTDLKRELEKLEFRTYPMVHEHKVGGCSGKLRFNTYVVAYIPSGDSGDGFTDTMKSIITSEDGERLKITYRDRTFRFRRENGEAV